MASEHDGSTGSESSDATGNSSGAGEGSLQVGDKSYTAEDVKTMVSQQTAVTQKLQGYAEVDAALARYGTDAETFIGQADGAFSVMSSLIDQGMIDTQGNILTAAPGGDGAGDGSGGTDDTSVSDLFGANGAGGKGNEPSGKDKQMSVIMDALGKIPDLAKKVEAVSDNLDKLDKVQSNIIRANLQDKIKEKHPNLTDEDVSKVFATAMRDGKKDVYEHANDASKGKQAYMDELKLEHAKEFGVDLDEFNENKLFESDPGGGAAIIVGGKRMSFKRGKSGAVTPLDATRDYMRRVLK